LEFKNLSLTSPSRINVSIIVTSSDVERYDYDSDGTLSDALDTEILDARSVVPEVFQQPLMTKKRDPGYE